jgi:hypothetical protein
MLCDGFIWYRALFADASPQAQSWIWHRAIVAKAAPHAETEPDALLLFCMACFFAWVASLLWLAGRNDDDK